MRAHELAKQLGFGSSKEFIEKLKELNFSVKSHLSLIDDETAEIIKSELMSLKEKKTQGNVVEVEFPLTVKDFSVKVGKKSSDIIQMLLKKGIFLNINQNIEQELVLKLALELGFNFKEKISLEETLTREETADKGNLKARPPIVTLMGHIDHGKTSLLDCVRKSKIVDKESGGITQHVGAYQIETPKGRITFIDTPGHETFTAMRTRGANITDIVILVVAADDGVMPQTEEAISHAKAAGVPIVVAINKIDKPTARPDVVKQQLSKLGFKPEDWGGDTSMVLVSAKTGQGIDQLLETILLEAEMLELKADFERSALGVVLETKLSKGLGPIATVVIQQGILKLADVVVCGNSWGKVRAIHDDRGNSLKEAVPSQAVEITGLQNLPSAADKFVVVPSEKEASKIMTAREDKEAKDTKPTSAHIKLEDLYDKIKKEQLKQFKIILKADTYGTLEAIGEMLSRIEIKEIEIQIIHKSIGPVNISDIILAEASDALIMGFKVNSEPLVLKKAQDKGIQIKTYQIIYELTADIKAALEGMLKPDIKLVFLGRARVKKVFQLSRSGVIAGCIVEKGIILRSSPFKVLRGQEVIFEGHIKSLKRFKDDVKEASEGFECGIGLDFSGIKEDDTIEFFQEEITTRRIDM